MYELNKLELLTDWGGGVYRDGDKAIKRLKNTSYDDAVIDTKKHIFAYESGLPVPQIHEITKYNETDILIVMDYIAEKPFVYAGMDTEYRDGAMRTMGKLLSMIHTMDTSEIQEENDYSLRYKNDIIVSPYITEGLKEPLISLFDRLHRNKRTFYHGDMGVHNLSFDGKKHWIIDWSGPFCGNPAADACNAYIYTKRYDICCADTFLQAYCDFSGMDICEVLDWFPIMAVHQMDIKDDDDRAVIQGFFYENIDNIGIIR